MGATQLKHHSHVRVICECGDVLEVKGYDVDDYAYRTNVLVESHYCKINESDGMEHLKPIDELVEENRKQLDDLHNKFLKWDDMEKHWMCTCPICRSLEIGGDCQ